MHPVDYGIVGVYLALLLWLGLASRLRPNSSAGELIIGGRMLTLPAFVASLVSTWYGGILGVGEYSFQYGLSNWLVFGVPYYLAAFLFAVFLARRARESEVLTIPERLAAAYDEKTAAAGSIIIYLMTVPAAYILMLGVLGEYLFGWPLWVGVVIGTIFSTGYIFLGGFQSVVRTDLMQFVLMFLGFAILLIFVVVKYGGYEFIQQSVPADLLTWHGGNSGWYVAVWYVIALATLIEPTFHQRCYAARDSKTARNGILISILLWMFFDFMTTSCGLYARAILPNLQDPVAAYPALANEVLPVGVLGLFALSLLATVMSTVDSYSHVAATTFGNDIMPRLLKSAANRVTRWSRIGLVVSAGLAIVLALFFRSVVDIWHAFGSIGTPALLAPVFTAFVGRKRLPAGAALLSIVLSGGLSAIWYLSQNWTADGNYWLALEPYCPGGIEPIFPGLILSLLLFFTLAKAKPQE